MTENILFNEEDIENGYQDLSDDQLKLELENYRNFCIKNLTNITQNISQASEELTVQSEAADRRLPDIETLKQLALYTHQVLLRDPLFPMGYKQTPISAAYSEMLGAKIERNVDRKLLCHNLKYMKMVSPLVAGDILKFIPLSLINEPPKQIPMYYSENLFSDVLPKHIIEWFQNRANLHILENVDGKIISRIEGGPERSRVIAVDFGIGSEHLNMVWMLTQHENTKVDEIKRIVSYRETLPKTLPTKEEFDIWVKQSINQTAIKVYKTIMDEVSYANQLNAKFLTSSKFVSEVIDLNLNPSKDFASDIANYVLKLKLPIIEKASLESIVTVRNNEEVFQNFRVELERQLKQLRIIKDESEKNLLLENISHDLQDVQINQINNKLKTLKRNIFLNSTLAIGSLATTFLAQPWNIIAAVGAVAKGAKNLLKYRETVRENPSYFLLRLKS